MGAGMSRFNSNRKTAEPSRSGTTVIRHGVRATVVGTVTWRLSKERRCGQGVPRITLRQNTDAGVA